jgi:hypothetical protein
MLKRWKASILGVLETATHQKIKVRRYGITKSSPMGLARLTRFKDSGGAGTKVAEFGISERGSPNWYMVPL